MTDTKVRLKTCPPHQLIYYFHPVLKRTHSVCESCGVSETLLTLRGDGPILVPSQKVSRDDRP